MAIHHVCARCKQRLSCRLVMRLVIGLVWRKCNFVYASFSSHLVVFFCKKKTAKFLWEMQYLYANEVNCYSNALLFYCSHRMSMCVMFMQN